MRTPKKSRSMLLPTISVFAISVIACGQPVQQQDAATKTQAQKTPIDRLVRASAFVKPSKPAVPQSQSTQLIDASNKEKLSHDKAKLEAMAAFLLGTTKKKPEKKRTAKKRVEKRKNKRVPTPQAGPAFPRTNYAQRVTRDAAPVLSQPIDEIASQDLASTLTDASFSEVMSSWHGVTHCIKSITSRGPGGSGALKLSFEINSDGSVKESKVANASNGIAQQVGRCVTRQAHKIQFPAYAGTKIVSKEAKFIF